LTLTAIYAEATSKGVADRFLYRRNDHATGDLLHDTFAWKLWIPSELVPEILKRAHDDPLTSYGEVHKT